MAISQLFGSLLVCIGLGFLDCLGSGVFALASESEQQQVYYWRMSKHGFMF